MAITSMLSTVSGACFCLSLMRLPITSASFSSTRSALSLIRSSWSVPRTSMVAAV